MDGATPLFDRETPGSHVKDTNTIAILHSAVVRHIRCSMTGRPSDLATIRSPDGLSKHQEDWIWQKR